MKSLAFVLLAVAWASAQGPIVYISGDNGVAASGSGFALGKIGLAGSTVEKRDKTTAMARVLLKSCPEISLTVSESDSHPDYLLLLNREDDAFGSASNEVMVLRPDKSVIFASKQGSVSRATKDGCKAIMADWKDRRPHTARSRDANSDGSNSSNSSANWNIPRP
jgi:hypothetical protein